ncbi:MAG: hypothetical protein L3J84_07260 [Gammaproteobacteria bacterium]|nr:hypothetical protein [Gammaproteobacteria bacterium]
MNKMSSFLALLVMLGVPQVLIAATAVINDANGTVYEFNSQVVQDVDLVLVSIYEVENRALYPDNIANVVIENGGEKPIVLVLSSYEQVHWAINVTAGVEIKEVILNGYYVHDFSGVSASIVTNKSGVGNYLGACGYSYPYIGGGCDTNVLIDEVENFTGLSLNVFAGSYKASDFAITSGGTPLIDISSNAGTFIEGETINTTLSISNSGGPINADIWVALQLPNGSLYHPYGNPALACSLIPSGQLVADLPLLNYTFPAGSEGEYIWYASISPCDRPYTSHAKDVDTFVVQ